MEPCAQSDRIDGIEKSIVGLSSKNDAQFKLMDHLLAGITNNAEHITEIRESIATIDQRTSTIEKKLDNGITDKLNAITVYVQEKRKQEEEQRRKEEEKQRKLEAEAADKKKRIRENARFIWQSAWKYFIRFVAAYAALKLFGVDPLNMLK